MLVILGSSDMKLVENYLSSSHPGSAMSSFVTIQAATGATATSAVWIH